MRLRGLDPVDGEGYCDRDHALAQGGGGRGRTRKTKRQLLRKRVRSRKKRPMRARNTRGVSRVR